MRVHLVQLDIAWESRAVNFGSVRRLLAESPPGSGDLVLLPEMFDSGFSFNLETTADRRDETLHFLRCLAADLRAFVLAGRTILGPDGRGRNRATALGPDGAVLAEYDKIHPFSFGKENDRFSGGDRVVTFPWQDANGTTGLRVCPAVCYDLRFPELFRRGLSEGAEAFAIIANWPAPRAAHFRALTIARAMENQAYAFFANRVGRDPNAEYAGASLVVAPTGDVVAEGDDRERVVSAEVDPAAVHAWRSAFPAWRDRRL